MGVSKISHLTTKLGDNMKKIKNLFKAIKERKLCSIIVTVLKNKRTMFRIKEKSIKNLQLQEIEYKRIKKKYSYILEKEIDVEKQEISNKIWICWLQGIENAPEIVKKCLMSVKKYCTDREIVCIDLNNYSKYIQMPKYIIEKLNKGIISYTHFSDLLRLELLTQYGGLWLDSTVLLTGKLPEYIISNKLFVYKNINLDKSANSKIVASNWLIYACSHNQIVESTRNLLFEYWKNEKKIREYYVFHLFFKIATEKYEKEWINVPTYNNIAPHILQFELSNEYNKKRFEQIKEISSIHKLDKSVKNNDKNIFTNLDYILKENDL